MSETEAHDTSRKQLLERMVEAKQLSSADAETLARQCRQGSETPLKSEESVLRWLAKEYDLAYTALEEIEPDRQILSLFPARVLLKEQLLPLRRTNGTVEVATSRLFATQGLDALKTMTGLRLKPVLAPAEAIEREMKKRLGVGADTIDTLDEEAPFQVVDENKEVTNLDSAAEDASIIRFVNQVLKDAIELRASGDGPLNGTIRKVAYLGGLMEYSLDTDIGALFVISTAVERPFTAGSAVGIALANHGVVVIPPGPTG